MFCEKCGAKLEDGSTFCEKCGARTEEVVDVEVKRHYVESNAVSAGAVQVDKKPTEEIGKVLSIFFKDPISAIKMCCNKDYTMYGVIFLGAKCLLIALLFTAFKDMIADSVSGFYWLYQVSSPLAFVIVLFMLLIADCCWVGLCIGICKIVDKQYDIKKIIGTVAVGQIYIPIIVVIGLFLAAIFGYTGADITYMLGIITAVLFQYECISAPVNENGKRKVLYGMILAGLIYSILWIAMTRITGNIYLYSYY